MRRLFILLAVLVIIGIPVFLGLTATQIVPASALGPHTPNLDNGRTMFFAGGCASCHATPGQDDPLQLGGGVELGSDFGIFRAPNISPHPSDGIGAWSEADFVTAMLKGTSPGGRHYYPAFPYSSYQRMRMDDVRDLFAFIRTLPEAEGRASGHDLSFPYNIRAGLGLWKWLYLDGEPFHSDPARSEQWNRGAYLVEGPGHCAECHSPRNFLGAVVTAQRYAGGLNPTGEGIVPNITQHAQGIADWGEDDIEYMLETGDTPEFDSVGGDMAAVVRNTAQLSAEDRQAMAHYLKSLPPVPGPARN